VRIITEVALEQLQAGSDPDEITPFWRVIDAKSNIAKKVFGAPDIIRQLRIKEGIAT
jgi:hypothetical protein